MAMREYPQGMSPSTYRILHMWVEKQLGKPQRCEMCGTTEARRYDWANKSGEYRRDLADWRRLCRPCHQRESHIGFCVNGHELTPENTYLYPGSTKNECRKCRRVNHRKSNQAARLRKSA